MFRKMFVVMSLLVVMAMPFPAQGVAGEIGPKQAVEITVNGVIDVLKARVDQKSLSEKDREHIREAVSEYFDFEEMAKRSLAAPWKDLNEKQKTEFVGLFQQLLELTYGNRLAGFHHQTVEYGEEFIKGRIAIVDSDVLDADKRTPVRYKLVSKEVGWRVYDIQIEGISMISTFRTDFTTSVNKDGIEGFLTSLRARVDGMQHQEKG